MRRRLHTLYEDTFLAYGGISGADDETLSPEMMHGLQAAYSELLDADEAQSDVNVLSMGGHRVPYHRIDPRPIHGLSGNEFLTAFQDTVIGTRIPDLGL